MRQFLRLILATASLMGLIACGQKFKPQQSHYSYVDPNIGAVVDMRPASSNQETALKDAYKIEFQNPKIQVLLASKQIRFTVTQVTPEKSENIELLGTFDEKLYVWLKDVAPVNGKNRMKGFAYCLASEDEKLDCSQLFIEVHFKHQEQELKYQFHVTPLAQINEPTEGESTPAANTNPEPSQAVEATPEETPEEGEAVDEHADEGTGEETTEGSYVTPQLAEKYWDDIALLQNPQTITPNDPINLLNPDHAVSFMKASLNNALDNSNIWNLDLTGGGRARAAYFSLKNKATGKDEPGKILGESTHLPETGLCYTRYGQDHKAYATGYTADFLNQNSCEFAEAFKQCGILSVGNLSNKRGGPVRFERCEKNGKCYHRSHQNGLEYDIQYLKDNCNYEYFKMVSNAKNQLGQYVTHSIFVHAKMKQNICAKVRAKKVKTEEDRRLIKALNAEPYHHDHSHVRLKCSPEHIGCWQQDELVDQTVSCKL